MFKDFQQFINESSLYDKALSNDDAKILAKLSQENINYILDISYIEKNKTSNTCILIHSVKHEDVDINRSNAGVFYSDAIIQLSFLEKDDIGYLQKIMQHELDHVLYYHRIQKNSIFNIDKHSPIANRYDTFIGYMNSHKEIKAHFLMLYEFIKSCFDKKYVINKIKEGKVDELFIESLKLKEIDYNLAFFMCRIYFSYFGLKNAPNNIKDAILDRYKEFQKNSDSILTYMNNKDFIKYTAKISNIYKKGDSLEQKRKKIIDTYSDKDKVKQLISFFANKGTLAFSEKERYYTNIFYNGLINIFDEKIEYRLKINRILIDNESIDKLNGSLKDELVNKYKVFVLKENVKSIIHIPGDMYLTSKEVNKHYSENKPTWFIYEEAYKKCFDSSIPLK
jgi:hypothetical protein